MGAYFRFSKDNFNAPRVVEFLRHLLRHLRGHVIVLWDGAKIHKGPLIRPLCADYPRLHLERFPAYAPELNPVEFIWNDFKRHTSNSSPETQQEVRSQLHGNARRARRSQQRLRSYILASDLPSPP
jgi:putative transposase